MLGPTSKSGVYHDKNGFNEFVEAIGGGVLKEYDTLQVTKKALKQDTIKLGASWTANRKEVIALAEWVVDQLHKKNFKNEDTDEYYEYAKNIYEQGIKKLSEILAEGCKEQGVVLSGIWSDYDKLISEHVEKLQKRTYEKEHEINKVSKNLLEKFESKFKEMTVEIKNLNKTLEKAAVENIKLREMVKDYEFDQNELLAICEKLRTENKKLMNNSEDMHGTIKAMKLILMQTDANHERGIL